MQIAACEAMHHLKIPTASLQNKCVLMGIVTSHNKQVTRVMDTKSTSERDDSGCFVNARVDRRAYVQARRLEENDGGVKIRKQTRAHTIQCSVIERVDRRTWVQAGKLEKLWRCGGRYCVVAVRIMCRGRWDTLSLPRMYTP